MGEKTDQIALEIEQARTELGSHLQELELKAKRTVDWRERFQERPWLMLGAAFAGGFMLSRMFGGRRERSA